MHVLIVDDYEMTTDLLRRLCARHEGVTAIGALSLTEANAAMDGLPAPLDVLVLDFQLGRHTADEFLTTWSRQLEEWGTKIIVFTATDRNEVVGALDALGIEYVFVGKNLPEVKPFARWIVDQGRAVKQRRGS